MSIGADAVRVGPHGRIRHGGIGIGKHFWLKLTSLTTLGAQGLRVGAGQQQGTAKLKSNRMDL
jgi:hypothetical protein